MRDFIQKHIVTEDRVTEAKESLSRSRKYITVFLKWAIFGTILGLICGFVGVAFHYSVDGATQLRLKYPYVIYLLPVFGLIIVFLYRKAGQANDTGTNKIFDSIRTSENLLFRRAPLIFIGTVLTHFGGGSSGREGAALQIGGSFGSFVGKWAKLKPKEMTLAVMCGMSAMFSALFGTPLTACIFSMEVIGVGSMYYSAMIPCLFSALVASMVAKLCHVHAETFSIANIPTFQIDVSMRVIVLAILCALLVVIFCEVMNKAEHLYKKKIKNPYIRVVVGGILVILLTTIVGSQTYNGAGMDVIEKAMHGNAHWKDFLLKILFTAVTLEAGYKGGEIVPTFFIGSTFGCVVGALIGLDPGFAASLGLIATFCGVVNCPVASICLSIEMFGGEGILYYALACAIANLLSGHYSLYSSQKIVYSKLEPTFVNESTK